MTSRRVPEDNNDEMENSEAEAPMHACCPGKGNEEPKLAKSKETLQPADMYV